MSNHIAQLNETLDYQALQKEGGPATYTKQIGYGLGYLVATVIVFGDNYDQAKITFANSAGQLFPVSGIFLNPQNTTVKNAKLTSGLMTLMIDIISFEPPTPDTRGSVSLTGSWTDLNGSGNYQYTGPIANWTNPPS
ncbi:hypothetical protein [Edaphocola aurantiacus]|uniref:hypothetical protein n=1 Tax=Edaphocola aurantiacus TaxID=2601682 RepID=UPI001C97EDA8|nr:hypothetical protein [Edaphocola aurantiacus]